jgi:hypothetical protein
LIVAEHSRGGRYVPPGRYMRLMRGKKVIMSNTPGEIRDLDEFRRRATGDVLINGLGLGVAVHTALAKPEVSHRHGYRAVGRRH